MKNFPPTALAIVFVRLTFLGQAKTFSVHIFNDN